MVDNGTVKMVTTDGHRLAYIEKKESTEGSMDALIPKKALTELTKIARDSNGEVSFGEDPNHIYFEVNGRLLITRKLSGTFPNYEMVIPKGNDKTAIFDAEEMKRAIARVSLMADERTRSVKLHFKPNEIQISSQAAEEGEADEIITADYSGDEVQIDFKLLGEPASYGFGWFLSSFYGHKLVTHGGVLSGFSSSVYRFGDDGLTIFVLCNNKEGERKEGVPRIGHADALARDIADIYFPKNTEKSEE